MIPLRYTTPAKLMRYIGSQVKLLGDIKTPNGMRRYESPKRFLSDYRDYIEMGEKHETKGFIEI